MFVLVEIVPQPQKSIHFIFFTFLHRHTVILCLYDDKQILIVYVNGNIIGLVTF